MQRKKLIEDANLFLETELQGKNYAVPLLEPSSDGQKSFYQLTFQDFHEEAYEKIDLIARLLYDLGKVKESEKLQQVYNQAAEFMIYFQEIALPEKKPVTFLEIIKEAEKLKEFTQQNHLFETLANFYSECCQHLKENMTVIKARLKEDGLEETKDAVVFRDNAIPWEIADMRSIIRKAVMQSPKEPNISSGYFKMQEVYDDTIGKAIASAASACARN